MAADQKLEIASETELPYKCYQKFTLATYDELKAVSSLNLLLS